MSYFNVFIPLVILIPNIFLLLYKPTNTPKISDLDNKEQPVFVLFERLGQVGLFTIPLLYSFTMDTLINKICFLFMALSLLVYYYCWVRFFIKGRNYTLLFQPLWKLPIPLAITPILYFTFASKILNSIPLFLAVILFSIGHLVISYNQYMTTNKI